LKPKRAVPHLDVAAAAASNLLLCTCQKRNWLKLPHTKCTCHLAAGNLQRLVVAGFAIKLSHQLAANGKD